MTNKIRQKHELKVPRRIVHAMMYDLDAEGLEQRGLTNRERQRHKGKFTTRGPNWVHSLDGHAKLMGFQKDTFPLAIYGCLDTASRKLLFLKIGPSNPDPRVIGLWYLEFLYEAKKIDSKIRIDKGTETGKMATLHTYLRSKHGDMDALDTVMYGKSTSNQVLFSTCNDQVHLYTLIQPNNFCLETFWFLVERMPPASLWLPQDAQVHGHLAVVRSHPLITTDYNHNSV
jgi:hypothetical protein